MTEVAVETLLVLAVLAAWLGALGFARLKTPFDRLHAVTFTNAASGIAIVAGAFIADGGSDRAVKILVLTAAVLLAGAALAHATGRALRFREKAK